MPNRTKCVQLVSVKPEFRSHATCPRSQDRQIRQACGAVPALAKAPKALKAAAVGLQALLTCQPSQSPRSRHVDTSVCLSVCLSACLSLSSQSPRTRAWLAWGRCQRQWATNTTPALLPHNNNARRRLCKNSNAHWEHDPVHGRQIGSKCPIVHAKQDSLRPVHFSTHVLGLTARAPPALPRPHRNKTTEERCFGPMPHSRGWKS
jgi:hypothetical protein